MPVSQHDKRVAKKVAAKKPLEPRLADKPCPRCGELRPITPTRRTCGPCFREIEKGGDRRIAEGLSPLGFWDLPREARRTMWKVWIRTMADALLAPVVAGFTGVEVRELRSWYTAGCEMPPERLVGPVIETVVYLSRVEKMREPSGSSTNPREIKSVPIDVAAVGRFFGVEMKVVDRHFPPSVEG